MLDIESTRLHVRFYIFNQLFQFYINSSVHVMFSNRANKMYIFSDARNSLLYQDMRNCQSPTLFVANFHNSREDYDVSLRRCSPSPPEVKRTWLTEQPSSKLRSSLRYTCQVSKTVGRRKLRIAVWFEGLRKFFGKLSDLVIQDRRRSASRA